MMSWIASWTGTLAAWVAAGVTLYVYFRTKQISDRTVTIEAQKMLLEINKQYVAEPSLLVLEGEKGTRSDDFEAKLCAMAYLKLNVFEIIFAALADEAAQRAWTNYFEKSLRKSDLLGKEINENREIYHERLLEAYDAWSNREQNKNTSVSKA